MFRLELSLLTSVRQIEATSLPPTGAISLSAQTVRFTRPGLTEEYTVSMDGLRQDFIVEEPPEAREASWSAPALWRFSPSHARTNQLLLTLSVTGARVEPAPDGARLVLQNSGRQIAYTRLRVTDATGKELPAHIEVRPQGAQASEPREASWTAAAPCRFATATATTTNYPSSATSTEDSPNSALPTPHSALAIVINDSSARYPLRIDPTFSDANWVSMGDSPGVSGGQYVSVNASLVDGLGNLYIGGLFTAVGHVPATNIAKWNGTNWSALGLGLGNGVSFGTGVFALAIMSNTLYAGGGFTTAGNVPVNYIAQWNGTNWSALGSGVSGYTPNPYYTTFSEVAALAVSGNVLYVGGTFTNAGGILASNIAQWNGTTWSALGSGVSGPVILGMENLLGVFALAVSGNNLYAGGAFSNAGGNAASSIAQWDGTEWSAVGSGVSGGFSEEGPFVYSLAFSGNTLYAGGLFSAAGGNPATAIAQWNGMNWSTVGSGLNGNFPQVRSLVSSGSASLYAAGNFTTAGGITVSNVALWNGTNWSALGSGVNSGGILTMAVSGSTLYSGGTIDTAGGVTASNIVQWNGTNWANVASGLNEYVNALTVSGSNLYAGGVYFNGAGSGPNYVAQWTGTSWLQLGTNFNNAVLAVAVYSNILYAGGQFTEVGTNYHAQYIAQWNGTNWLPVTNNYGGGLGATVYTLLAANGYLYAGGNFSDYVSQWNGTNWSPLLGHGALNGSVSALASSGNTLFAGGAFSQAGSTYTGSVAEWNGTNWSSVTDGLFNNVNALAVLGGIVYAGGTFQYAFNGNNEVFVNHIAQLNGTNWLPLGSGINGNVNALALSGGTLYAAGNFSTAGGVAANNIAQWNGTNWSALGSGLNTQVNALLVSGSTMYVGGTFTNAGTNVSAYAAEFILPIPLSILTTDSNFGFTNGYFGFDIVGPPGSYVVIQTSTDLQTWLPLQTNTLNPSGLLYFSDLQSPANTQRFYNVLLP